MHVNLHHWFARPEALWLLALVPVLGVLAARARLRRRRDLARWGSFLGPGAMSTSWRAWQTLRGVGRAVGLACVVLAIAGPRWGRADSVAALGGRDVVVVLDLSRSMLAQDVIGQSAPNRFGRAKDALFDLVDTVQNRGGHRLALVVFASRAQTLCPLTNDYDHFRGVVEKLDVNDPLLDIGPSEADLREGNVISGTRIGQGLMEAVATHDERAAGYQDIILISDGDDPADDEEWRHGIEPAKLRHIPVHCVGVGDPEKDSPVPGRNGPLIYQGKPVLTRLREMPLKTLADQTGGTYTPARTHALPLGELFQQRIEPRPIRDDEETTLPVYREHSAWFFAIGLAWFLLEIMLGDLARRERRRSVKELTA